MSSKKYDDILHDSIVKYFDYLMESFQKAQSYQDHLRTHFIDSKHGRLRYLSEEECGKVVKYLEGLSVSIDELITLQEAVATEMNQLSDNQDKIRIDNRDSKISDIISEPLRHPSLNQEILDEPQSPLYEPI